MTVLHIINDDERHFAVRLVRKHERYGSSDEAVHSGDEPVVELFDATSLEPGSEDFGYFTGVRCRVGCLFATAFESGDEADVLLNESLPMWNISAENLNAIQKWLRRQLHEEELTGLEECGEEFPDTVAAACIPSIEPLEAPAHSSIPPPSACRITDMQQGLLRLLSDLDALEQLDPAWRTGDVRVRLRLLGAKKELLKALALLA